MFRRPSLNRPGPRLGTFLGELALIVIGVLLALSVDEWRQARARTLAGEQAVVAIRAEIAANRELGAVDRDLRREITEAYKGQSRYEIQAENMSALIDVR